jgi:DNA helicase-2/ATP-dependent DNA helicase PcrA
MPLTNLNKEQYTSATCQAGYNLIIASAGTGKTSTIVGRIAYLLGKKIPPEQILLLTFTNKASRQMIDKVASYFDKQTANNIVAGTFHSVSFRLLKQLQQDITLKQPRELKTLFSSIYEKRIFLNTDENTKPYDGGYLYDMYSLFLNSRYDESFTTWLENKNEAQKIYCDIYEDVIDEFNELKKNTSM